MKKTSKKDDLLDSLVSLNQETIQPPISQENNKANQDTNNTQNTIKMEQSMKDDKRPEESLNSGENHVKEALKDLQTFEHSDTVRKIALQKADN